MTCTFLHRIPSSVKHVANLYIIAGEHLFALPFIIYFNHKYNKDAHTFTECAKKMQECSILPESPSFQEQFYHPRISAADIPTRYLSDFKNFTYTTKVKPELPTVHI